MTDAADVASDAEPTYRWSAQPPNLPRYGYAEITEALVPILTWPAVPVLKRVEHGLSVVERFVLEAALTLQGVRAEDITEITGIPTDIAFRMADRLRALGALDRVDDTFEPVEPVTREVLTSQRLPEYHQANLQFMYLADTDELIAYDSGPGTPDPPLVHLVPVACQAPVPAGLVGRSRATLLNERIAAGRVAGLPDWVHAAVDDDVRMPETSPAYRCRRGHLKSAGSGAALVLELYDGDNPERRGRPCSFDGADRLRERLRACADALDGALRPLTPASQAEATVLDDRTVRFFTVTTEGARYFGDQGLPISRPLGLSIRSTQAIVAVPARLAPADPAAAGLFALDHAVHHMLETPLSELTPQTAAQAVAGAVEVHQLPETAVTVDELRSELWRRRHFTPLYTLRAAEDFDYD
ncbi:hypothetical protein [Polymorphospora rubra]|uniref:hypothetical protein n=1 Tax=Polymorphospora rubra TaxID=338584 RepID=UPI0033F6C239